MAFPQPGFLILFANELFASSHLCTLVHYKVKCDTNITNSCFTAVMVFFRVQVRKQQNDSLDKAHNLKLKLFVCIY